MQPIPNEYVTESKINSIMTIGYKISRLGWLGHIAFAYHRSTRCFGNQGMGHNKDAVGLEVGVGTRSWFHLGVRSQYGTIALLGDDKLPSRIRLQRWTLVSMFRCNSSLWNGCASCVSHDQLLSSVRISRLHTTQPWVGE